MTAFFLPMIFSEYKKINHKESITFMEMARLRLERALSSSILTIQPTMNEAIDAELDRWHTMQLIDVTFNQYRSCVETGECKYQKFGSHIKIKEMSLYVCHGNGRENLNKLLSMHEQVVCQINGDWIMRGCVMSAIERSEYVAEIRFEGELAIAEKAITGGEDEN